MHVMVLSIFVYIMKYQCPKGTGHSSIYASILDTVFASSRQVFSASAATHETACLLRSFSSDALKISSICLLYTVS